MITGVDKAVQHVQTWKGPILDTYVGALLTEARRLYLIERTLYFNNDDVPEARQPNDGKTVGLAFRLLIGEGIIERYRGTHADMGIYGGYRKSTREKNNGHENPLYTIKSMRLLETWLERHGGHVEVQGRLFP